jgi:hypothetical protein
MNEIHYLTSDEEIEKYISHCNIEIGDDNVTKKETLLACHNEFISIFSKNNSITSSSDKRSLTTVQLITSSVVNYCHLN